MPLISQQQRSARAKRARSRVQSQEKAAIYIRVSFDKRVHKVDGKAMAEEIISPDTQERRARSYCESQGWEVVLVKSDIDESAYRQHYTRRKGLMDLVVAAERGEITKIVVFKFNRASRVLVEFLEICERVESSGGGVVSVSEQYDTSTPSGRMIRNIMASFAQYQSEELSEQIFETWMTKAKRGERPPGRPPYGTILQKGMLIPDPATHEHLLAMYRTFTETRSVAAVVDYLTERRIAPGGGADRWSLTVVRRILANAAYVGQIKLNDDTFDGNWAPIVPVDLWSEAQTITGGRRSAPPERIDSHLLRGHIVCSCCGRPMWTQYSKRWIGKQRTSDRFYWCADPKTLRDGCDMPAVHAQGIEEAAWSAVLQICRTPNLDDLVRRAAEAGSTSDETAQRRAQLHRERDRTEQQIRELFELLTDKHIDRQQFASQNRLYGERLMAIQQEMASLGDQAPRHRRVSNILTALKAAPLAASLNERRRHLADLGVQIHVNWSALHVELLGIRVKLKATLMGERWFLGDEYHRLDYQGTMLTNRQLEFVRRTYRWADKQEIARRIGRTYTALKKIAIKQNLARKYPLVRA